MNSRKKGKTGELALVRRQKEYGQPKDEPQTNADQHIQSVESVESVEQTEAWQEPFETDCQWK